MGLGVRAVSISTDWECVEVVNWQIISVNQCTYIFGVTYRTGHRW